VATASSQGELVKRVEEVCGWRAGRGGGSTNGGGRDSRDWCL